jgi:hypothetical protein
MDIVHVCIQYSNLQNIAKYWFHVPTMTKFHIFVRFISLTLYIRCMKVKLIVQSLHYGYCIFPSRSVFDLLVLPTNRWWTQADKKHFTCEDVIQWILVWTINFTEQADRKHFDLGRCSIHNADFYMSIWRLKIGGKIY